MLSNMLPVTLPSFNPRTRVGCDTSPATIRCRSSAFQSTHPRGVRPRPALRPGAMSCFNPRTRVGCDDGTAWEIGFAYAFQSTHPRGVRLPVMRRRFQPHHVSIHAPAWGTTLRQTSGQRLDSCFNPRTRVGCDCGCWCGPTASSRFNPRTRVGCDTATTTKAAPDLDVSIHAPAWGATGA